MHISMKLDFCHFSKMIFWAFLWKKELFLDLGGVITPKKIHGFDGAVSSLMMQIIIRMILRIPGNRLYSICARFPIAPIFALKFSFIPINHGFRF